MTLRVRMCWRRCRVFIFSCITCLLVVYLVLHFGTHFGLDFTDGDASGRCLIPDLPLGSTALEKKIIACSKERNWVYVDNGTVYIRANGKEEVRCALNYYWRKDDYTASYVLVREVANGTRARSDFFVSQCIAKDQSTFSLAHSTVVADETVVKRAEERAKSSSTTGLGLNVYMFGYDTVSRLDFIRRMPKTYEYATKKLNAVVLKGYNIVGDGTPQALIPMLTGKTELELPNTHKRDGDRAQYVNVYPFVWYNYRDAGYVTMWNEDSIHVGIFVYRLKGFNTQPTDHYLRTFFIEAEKRYTSNGLCLGDKPVFTTLLKYSEDFFTAYPNIPKFGVSFSDLSHDHHALQSAADDDTYEHLKFFEDHGHLNNTIIIMMSDHGPRFSEDRFSQQGKFEERLPFYSFIMPPWFEKAYPLAMKNLRANADKLTSPFDIYPTLRDVLDFGEGKRKVNVSGHRGISLFDNIPEERTCAQAGIEPHWCTCLLWKPVTNLKDELVRRLASDLIAKMNQVTDEVRELCVPLELKEVRLAKLYRPNQTLMRFTKTKDKDGFIPDLSSNTATTIVYYELQVATTPGNHTYEGTVRYEKVTDRSSVDLAGVSLLTSHKLWSSCLERDRLLQKYCVCRNVAGVISSPK